MDRGIVVNPMFVWTGVLLLTPCLCGHGRGVVVNSMFMWTGMLLSTCVCLDSGVNPMFV